MRLGIVMMPGGNALWDPLTVEENLRLGAFLLRNDDDERQRRLDRVLALFPELRDRLDQPAGTLSGGQKQMVALAKAMLLEPEVLLIDELSLGLSPIAAQQVLAKVEQLRDEGLTIVIVEQSVNVALSIADRAVFMEKGQVRFDGPAGELLERGDLLRAVFLGGDRRRSVATHDACSASSPLLGIDLNPQDLFDGAVTGLVYGFLGHRRDPAVPRQRDRQLRLRRHRVPRRGARGQDGHRLELAVRPGARSSAWRRRRAVAVRDRDDGRAPAVRLGAHHPVRRHHRRGAAGDRAGDQRAPGRGLRRRRSRRRSAAPGSSASSITVHAPAGRGARGDPAGGARRSAGSSTARSGASPSPPTAANPDASRLAGLSTAEGVDARVGAGRCARRASPPCSPRRCASTPVSNLAQASGIQLLVIALAVALLARMRSMLVAVVAGVVVGMVERVVFYNWANQSGLMEFVLFGIVLGGVLLARRGAVRRRRRRLGPVEPGGAAARPAAVARARAPAAVGAGR